MGSPNAHNATAKRSSTYCSVQGCLPAVSESYWCISPICSFEHSLTPSAPHFPPFPCPFLYAFELRMMLMASSKSAVVYILFLTQGEAGIFGRALILGVRSSGTGASGSRHALYPALLWA